LPNNLASAHLASATSRILSSDDFSCHIYWSVLRFGTDDVWPIIATGVLRRSRTLRRHFRKK
jgi:hypothetical protein